MWTSVPNANEGRETSNAAGNWRRKWITTDLIRCHPPWPGSCQSWHLLTADFTARQHRERERERERESLLLFKTHSVILIWTFLHLVKALGLSNYVRRVYFALKTKQNKRFLCGFATPVPCIQGELTLEAAFPIFLPSFMNRQLFCWLTCQYLLSVSK